ncbi:Transcriptional regulatory protein ZraR [Caulifigura coniformis]|uniref:DNA-binding transcriptional regulator NtrC n=2 Tax=Caulifigura coniformis TaxID=2527983 RepID=A0A517SBP7_9PLAN|nr:Transcriptional regulatory protein ZraR [Caulifigura coniformis]
MQIVIVDDEPSICWALGELLEEEGYTATAVGSAEEALELSTTDDLRLILLDVRLPGIDGISAMPLLRERFGPVPIVVMTAFGDLSTAVRAVESGATDYLCKPLNADDVTSLLGRLLLKERSEPRAATPRRSVAPEGTLVGQSPAMQKVFKKVALAAATDVPVLITGESGTGKELIARAIHQHGSRRAQPFVPVCLPALNPGLVEAELFGHERGTFTGADANRIGLLEAASGGSMFLDEIGDTPLELQVKLLRTIEYHEVTPVGGVRPRQVDFRVIAATNQPLERLVQQGRFRADLFYRLNVFVIEAPALRDRREDIPLLCDHFLAGIECGRSSVVSDEAMEELLKRPWNGNVREFRNAIEHAAVLARGGLIAAEHLPAPSEARPDTGDVGRLSRCIVDWTDEAFPEDIDASDAELADLYSRFLSTVEKPLLEATLEKCGGNQTAAATILGIHRSTLRQKLREAGLK